MYRVRKPDFVTTRRVPSIHTPTTHTGRQLPTHGKIFTLFVTLHLNPSYIPHRCTHHKYGDTDILAGVISVASAAAGYVYGTSHSREIQRSHELPTNTETQDQSSSSDDEDSAADGDLSAVTAGFLQ